MKYIILTFALVFGWILGSHFHLGKSKEVTTYHHKDHVHYEGPLGEEWHEGCGTHPLEVWTKLHGKNKPVPIYWCSPY